MKIEVTQEHIDRGIRGSTSDCPIALACPSEMMPLVGRWIVLTIAGKRRVYDLSDDAAYFAYRFDVGLAVEPFSFEIDEANPLR